MSKERELLNRYVLALKARGICPLLIKEIEELLAQPETDQEVVVWQYRTKPNWIDKWYDWENCSKESYEDYKRVPELHDWLYETREIYIKPPTHEPLSDEVIREFAHDSYFICNDAFIKGVRWAEAQHKIGVDDANR